MTRRAWAITWVAGVVIATAILLIFVSQRGTVATVSASVASPSPSESASPEVREPQRVVAQPEKSQQPQSIRGRGTAYLSVPAAGISRLEIVPYVGEPDDYRGTQINDAGLVGAPRGGSYGALPGQVGNLLLTAHRTSAGSPMLRVPELSSGDHIIVDHGKFRFVYLTENQLWINFREASSRALQEASVPGKPGRAPTRAAVVLSTCATPEDAARGDYWRDQFGNPTHRIAVAGFLSSVVNRETGERFAQPD